MTFMLTTAVIFGLCTFTNAAIVNSTNIAILNLTPYTWQQSAAPKSYQLSDWEKQWSKEIKPGVSSVRAAISVGLFNNNPSDSSGEVSYRITDDSDSTVQIQVRGGGKFPSYTFDTRASLQQISTSNNARGTTVSLGWDNDGWTPLIIGGKKGSLVGNRPPSDWMAQNLLHIGCLTLKSLVLPGSHNAGMSLLQDKTPFSTTQNTQSQYLNIKDQLRAGVRFLDIRPVLKDKNFKTGHWSDGTSRLGRQGANGQSIEDIINNVNDFTKDNKELVIIYLSHTLDDNFRSFNDVDYTALLQQLSSLNNLYSTTSATLLDTPLSEIINSTSAAVMIIASERDATFLKDKSFLGRGFYPSTFLPLYDSYADSPDLATVRKDQYTKFTNETNHKDQLFVLSWTLTLREEESANPLVSIKGKADGANSRLFEAGSAPQCGVVQWVDLEKGLVPNVLMVDYVDDRVGALAVAMNRLNKDCSS